MRIRYLVRFEKTGSLKFIGHLDLLKLLQRCVKLSGINVDYSKGFNPRQLVSIALPLSVGMEGLNEYAVFEMKNEINEQEISDLLNRVTPQGLKITGCRCMNDTEKGPASLICAAEYLLILNGAKNLNQEIENILSSSSLTLEIPIRNKNKKSNKITNETKFMDIRNGIFNICTIGDNSVNMLLAQGSVQNLKPELVAMYLCGKMGFEYIPYKCSYTRKEMYKYNENGALVSAFE